MTDSKEELQLVLEAVPESVGAARHAVAYFAEGLGMVKPALDDLKTVVSEASSNVVRHAYPSEPRGFELQARPVDDELRIVVRDFGQGLRAQITDGEPSLRLGLGLISMLSSRYEIFGHADGGTEIRISLPLRP